MSAVAVPLPLWDRAYYIENGWPNERVPFLDVSRMHISSLAAQRLRASLIALTLDLFVLRFSTPSQSHVTSSRMQSDNVSDSEAMRMRCFELAQPQSCYRDRLACS